MTLINNFTIKTAFEEFSYLRQLNLSLTIVKLKENYFILPHFNGKIILVNFSQRSWKDGKKKSF